MKILLKIIAGILAISSATLILLFIWTNIITFEFLVKAITSMVVVIVLVIILHFIANMNSEQKLKKDGFLIE